MAKILIVDDDADTRVRLNAILGEELGHDIFFAPDGEAAIKTHGRVWPDLVVTDLVMPELNGILLIEHLKAIDPSCPIIAISGKAPEQLETAEAAGAVAALTKPIQKEKLLAAIERALSRQGFWERE